MDDKLFSRINEFADGELEPHQEVFLFEQLAVDPEARNYFRKISLLKNELKNSDEEFPLLMENKISSQIKPEKNLIIRYAVPTMVLAGMISLILLIVSIYLINEMSGYRKEINSVVNQVKIQNKTIEELYNSLPPVDVRAIYSNEIIIKPKI